MAKIALSSLLLALSLGACADATGSDVGPHVGTYSLVAVDGHILPAMILESGDESFELVGGTFTLKENGYYHSAVSIRVTEEGAETVFPAATTGTYDASGAQFSFVSREGTETEATLTGNRLRVAQNGVVLDFVR